MNGEKQYLSILDDILNNGHYRKTRNGNTFSLFGKHMEFDLKNNQLPILTTKKVFLRGIFEELLFFLKGQTNTKLMQEKGVNIWKGNTNRDFLDTNGFYNYDEGDMGPMYFYQIYHFNYPYNGCLTNYNEKGFNQFNEVINLLKYDRYSRRIFMTTYNPLQAKEGVLYPCHGIVIQFAVQGENELCCHMYQRSADFFLGICYNITSYSLLVLFLVQYLNDTSTDDFKFVPGKLCISMGDCHIYESHISAVKEQLSREPYPFPKLKINKPIIDLTNIDFSFIELIDYVCHPTIKVDMIS
jgi:thymidylate synthase